MRTIVSNNFACGSVVAVVEDPSKLPCFYKAASFVVLDFVVVVVNVSVCVCKLV